MSDKEKQDKKETPNTVIIEGIDQHIKKTTHIISNPVPQPKPQEGES